MATHAPDAWERMQGTQETSGQFMTPQGLATFRKIDLCSDTAAGTQGAAVPSECWFLVSMVDNAALVPDMHLQFGLGVVATLLLGGVLAWVWSMSRVRKILTEEARREEEHLVRVMGDTVQDGLAMIDDRGLVRFWNQSAERLLGLTREEMLGAPLHKTLAAHYDLEQIRSKLKHFAQTGQGEVLNQLTELTAKHRDGAEFPIELAVTGFLFKGRWHAVGTMRDIAERKQAEEQLTKLATTDPLTGLCNRRRFMALCEEEFARCNRYGHPFSLIMLDLDHFKSVNDTHGHAVGDQVLITVARTGLTTLRDVDAFGRIGGEEFAIMLPETDLQGAVHTAERFRETVNKLEIPTQGKPLKITISFGVAQAGESFQSVDGLLTAADKALYVAKENGRNRVEAFIG